jgi:hypothetical protein
MAEQQTTLTGTLEIDDQTQQFLNCLHRGGGWSYWWRSLDKRSCWWRVGSPVSIPVGGDLYFGVHPSKKNRGSSRRSDEDNILSANCLYADFDAKHRDKACVLDAIEQLPFPPSVVIDSGGGYHGYWLFSETLSIDNTTRDRIKKVQANWVDRVGADPAAKDLARMLRVPGTRNCKDDYAPEYPLVSFIWSELDRRYGFCDLEEQALSVETDQQIISLPEATGYYRDHTSYVEAALSSEVETLSQTPEGERNDQLNRSAFNMGQFVGAGVIDRDVVELTLTEAAVLAGLPESEIERTLKSGLDKGIELPRDISNVEMSVSKGVRVTTASGNAPVSIKTDTVKPFPSCVFPNRLRHFIESASEALPAPADFVGVPMIAVLGTAIGTRCSLETKVRWRESSRIWSAVVARPGTKKSPALDFAMEPLHRAQKELGDSYETECLVHEAELARYLEEKQKGKKERQKPAEPRLSQIYTTDATLESLGELLSENTDGLAFVRDELSGWALSMNQYKGGRGADRQSWLSIWSGAGVIINRKSRSGPIVLENPFICVTGSIQPDVLGDLADEQGREDGFLHRILFAYPDEIQMTWTDAVVDDETMEAYCGVFRELQRLPEELSYATFTNEGKAEYIRWVDGLYGELSGPTLADNLRGPYAKMEGYCARMALVLHLSRYVCGEASSEQIDQKSVLGAVKLTEYFMSHLPRVYGRLFTTKEDRQLFSAVEQVRKRGGRMALRDMLVNKVGGVKKEKDRDKLIQELTDQGYGQVHEETTTSGHKRRVFVLS